MKVILVILSLLMPSYSLAENPFTNFISGFFSKKEQKKMLPDVLMEEILSFKGSCFEKELRNNFTFENTTSSIYSIFRYNKGEPTYKKPRQFRFDFHDESYLSINVEFKPNYCRLKYPQKITLNEKIDLNGSCYRKIFVPDYKPVRGEYNKLPLEFSVNCKIKIWNVRDCFRKSEFNKYSDIFKHRELDCDIPKIERDKFRKEAKLYWLNEEKN